MINATKSELPAYPKFSFEADNLSVRRGGRHVFENVSLSLQNGSLLYLHGANGTGKSTLIRTLSERLAPIEGETKLIINGSPTELSDNLMVLDHSNGLKNSFTLLEQCQFFIQIISGMAVDANKIGEGLETLKLSHLMDQPIKYFSSGQRRRAALLRFLLLDRPIWFMDEPTVGVDAANRKTLADILTAHIKRGGAAIIATHDDIGIKGDILNLDGYMPKEKHGGYWS